MGELELDGHVTVQPYRQYSKFEVTTPQPDYMSWSTASIFLCFAWGIFAYIASNKVRKFNKIKAYDQAAHYSMEAKKYNQSAVACCIIMVLSFSIPLSIALAVQGSADKFPSARVFFGK